MAQHPIDPNQGGTGVSNNNASTLTLSGNYPLTVTLTAATNITFPTTGTLLTSGTGVASITGTTNQVIASAATGAVTLSLPQPINSTATPTFNQITLNNSPVNNTDVATKSYVDAATTGLNIHDACDSLADSTNTTILSGSLYTAGSTGADGGTGVGATLTDTSTGTVLVVDGHTVALNERILVNLTDGTGGWSGLWNGIYTLTTVGVTGTTKWVLTRATDYDNHTAGQVVPGDFVFISEGTVYKSTGWVETAIGSLSSPHDGIKIGTDKIASTQFSGSGTYTAGTGLSLTGTQFSNTGVLSLAGTANQIAVSGSTGNITLSFPQNIIVSAPTTGSALTVHGVSAADTLTLASATGAGAGADLRIERSGSTANTISAGPNILLQDQTSGNYAYLQASGGQVEIWQGTSGTDWQAVYLNASGMLNINTPQSGVISLSANDIAFLTVRDKTDNYNGGASVTAGTITVDFTLGNVQRIVLGASALTVNFTNVPAAQGQAQTMALIFVQDATGSRTLPTTYQINGVAATVNWDNGVTPVLTTTANQSDIIQIMAMCITSGTTVLAGAQVMGNVSNL